MIVDYAWHDNVTDKRHAQGQHVAMGDGLDNRRGVADQNYALSF